MAGDWIKVDCDLPDKPEVDRVADLCGMTSPEVIGRLVLLWVFVDRHCHGPVTKNVTPVTLCRRMQCDRAFLDALVTVGWLIYDDTSVTIPGWEQRFSESAKSRAKAALRKRDQRHKSVTNSVTGVTKKRDQRREEKSINPLPPKGGRCLSTQSNGKAPDLRDTQAIVDWHERQTAAGQYGLNGSEVERLNLVALAEYAIEKGDDPPRIFLWGMANRNLAVERITQAHEERARKRLLSLRRETSSVQPGVLAAIDQVAAALRVPGEANGEAES